MVIASNLGFPRMGENRELKKLVESHWSGETSLSALLEGAKALRATHWKLQHSQGIQLIPSNDFSFYDHVLDHILLFGAIPPRYQQVLELDGAPPASWVGLKTYFAMARGFQSSKAAFDASCSRAGTAFDPSAASPDKSIDVGSMEMKKWFDTNYHYMVPEFLPNQEFRLTSTSANGVPKPVAEYLEAKALGLETRPVILGPLSFLLLGKSADASRPYTAMTDALVHLEALLPVYLQLLSQLGQAGARWVQLDEPILALDLDLDLVAPRFKQAYASLRSACPEGLSLLVASYFGELRENFTRIVVDLPIHALHVDATRSSPAEVASIIANLPAHLSLSLGVIDGRNIWKTDLKRALELVSKAVQALGSERVLVAPSCSLLHSPHSLAQEAKKMDAQILDWLAFAVEKLAEISFLAQAATAGGEAGLEAHPNLRAYYLSNQKSVEERRTSPRIHVAAVKAREQGITGEMFRRQSAFPLRREQQRKRLTTLPAYFPTTTIGSFPQTKEVRAARSAFKNGKLGSKEYDSFLREQISACVKMQEECGLDVLVHGEFERTDMVEYFGEHLEGYVFTSNGWVQSYGSRCVKPPIIFGDVSRPRPMTLQYTTYAQSLTKKPMKGMLTGPVTILQWSFVRDDQPRSVTCFQLALAIRDEVADLESNGIACIQIDEPAIREGLPLRHSDWNDYLKWAVDSFLLSSTGIKDHTQIHTHMCYSDFNDIFEAIKRMDADVITIENSKSDLKLLRAFEKYGYTNEIGPGLYDIHSPRIPTTKEMVERVQQMLKYLDKASLWVNPDCGLKTRGWPETRAALENMVEVAHQLRLQFSKD